MKECCLIQDSMPLYLDGICSDATKEYIAEHLQSCEECKKVYEDMRTSSVPEPAAELPQNYLDEVEPLKKIRKVSFCLFWVSCFFYQLFFSFGTEGSDRKVEFIVVAIHLRYWQWLRTILRRKAV